MRGKATWRPPPFSGFFKLLKSRSSVSGLVSSLKRYRLHVSLEIYPYLPPPVSLLVRVCVAATAAKSVLVQTAHVAKISRNAQLYVLTNVVNNFKPLYFLAKSYCYKSLRSYDRMIAYCIHAPLYEILHDNQRILLCRYCMSLKIEKLHIIS